MANVMNGVLAFGGDKGAALAQALIDMATAAARGWANGDVSVMTETVKACKKTRTGQAVADVTQAYADIIRAQVKGQRIVIGDDAPAWRGQCFLPGLPSLPETLKGKELAKALDSVGGWGSLVAKQWFVAVELHVAAAKAAADGKRDDAKALKAAAAAAAAAVVGVVTGEAVAEEQAETMGPDIPSLNDLQAQLDSAIAERDALRVGNAGLSVMVASLKAELLALRPLPVETAPATPYGDLSAKAREAVDKASKQSKRKQAQPA